MNKTISVLAFVIGAAVGSVATWQLVKTKYKNIAQEEIDSVKESFRKKQEDLDIPKTGTKTVDPRAIAEQAKDKPDVISYASKIRNLGYSPEQLCVRPDAEEEPSPDEEDDIHVIPPDELGDYEDYDTYTLRYYADKYLTDENDGIIRDVEEAVGLASLDTFGEYEDDCVYVRNDLRKCYYEILLDPRKYADTSKRKPHEVDD